MTCSDITDYDITSWRCLCCLERGALNVLQTLKNEGTACEGA